MSARREYVRVHDLAGNQIGVIGRDFRELYTDTTLDQTETLHFTIPATHPKAYLLNLEARLRLRGRTYRVREITQERTGPATVIKVEAPAIWDRLGENDHIGSLVIDQLTPAGGGALILAQTSWTVGSASVQTGAFSMEAQDRSFLSMIRTWAKITGTVIEFDTQARTVSWLATRGADLGLAFRKGRNLRNVVRRRTPPQVTALFPYGRDDLTIAGVNGGDAFVEDLSYYTALGITEEDARNNYGKRRAIRDQAFVKEADLLAWAQSKIADEAQSIQSVELDVVDISELTGVAEDLQVGDRCRAFDPDFDEEFVATVTRLVKHPLEPWRNAIELSTSPQVVDDPDASAGRPQQSNEWILFQGPVQADFKIRSDATWTVARIPLRFRPGGRAHYHLDLWLTGVDAGTATVNVYDAEAEENVRETLTVAYTNGERVRVHLTWSAEELEGTKDYRIRVTTAATGGASAAKGVDLDLEDDGSASFYILAQGAVQETPVETNSVTFDFTGAVQTWTVPDNVTGPVTISAKAGRGGRPNGGAGTQVLATFPTVIPGQVFDVYVGGGVVGTSSPSAGEAGWPNGGDGGAGAVSGSPGGGGNGASYVTPSGGSIADALLVAPGGGGAPAGTPAGGAAKFFIGDDGADAHADGGAGATQSAPGAGGAGNGGGNGTAGDTIEQGAGGAGGAGGALLGNGGGGGGGGIHGGGGGGATGTTNGAGPGGGGGGSGMVRSDGYDLSVVEGITDLDGQIVISWETPA